MRNDAKDSRTGLDLVRERRLGLLLLLLHPFLFKDEWAEDDLGQAAAGKGPGREISNRPRRVDVLILPPLPRYLFSTKANSPYKIPAYTPTHTIMIPATIPAVSPLDLVPSGSIL